MQVTYVDRETAALPRGIAYALAAGLMWGLVFVAPAMLPQYPPAALAFGRYLAFGLIALLLVLPDRAALSRLTRADWLEALKLALVGNIIYYLFLAAGIQAAGVPLGSVIIGTLPVVIAVCANWTDRHLPWARLAPSLGLMATGIALVNHTEFARIDVSDPARVRAYWVGGLLTVVAVACWTWYPIRNARWLQRHPHLASRAWATAQGLMTLPLAAAGWAGFMVWLEFHPLPGFDTGRFDAALGPEPLKFVGLMFAIGLFASWLGTLAWNRASQLLPTSLAGQLIVFETLAALAYGFMHRGQWPGWMTAGGIALLVAGVILGVRAFQRQSQGA
ncbi:DMT family transporter [Piscinibacterium candidicorallinum]|uniref:DMT family transporter n=1 Tax=Piscinibacterium candidicorallinum TaxID=1793872 RepID=A0ABV7GYN0_9BURK